MPDLEPDYPQPRRIPPLPSETSIGRTAELLRGSALPFLVVCDEDQVVGMVGEQELAVALAKGASSEEPVRAYCSRVPALTVGAERQQIIEALEASGQGAVVVLAEDGTYLGLITAADLLSRTVGQTVPHLVAGMATPFGVYLTTGFVSAGTGPRSLVATGAFLFLLFLLANGAAWLLLNAVDATFGTNSLILFRDAASVPEWLRLFGQLAVAVLFLGLLRASPLSATHGAEHKVVHAVERQERLIIEVVRRMPRVHHRCGTNLAAGAVLFLMLTGVGYSSEWRPLGLLGSLLITVALWRPLGQGLQRLFTTREPSDRQLRQAIEAAEELLSRARKAGDPKAPFPTRFLNSGVLHILLGALLCAAVADALERLLGFSFPILV